MSEEIKDTAATTETKASETTEVQSSPIEDKAVGLGWVPKDEWVEQGGDADDWKPAKVFLEHGEMIGKIRHQSKELQATKQALQFVQEKNKQVYETGYQAAVTQLRAEKRAALSEGDLVKADEIDEKIEQTKSQLQQIRTQQDVVPNKQQQPDPEHAQWLQRNPWYNDGVMQKFADALAIEYIQINNGQVLPSDVRDYVEKEVKKEFPNKFVKKTQGAPNPDGDGRGTTSKRSDSGLDSRLAKAKSEMTDDQRQIMKTLIKSAGMTEKAYLEMYLS